jgi:hypothetical protein
VARISSWFDPLPAPPSRARSHGDPVCLQSGAFRRCGTFPRGMSRIARIRALRAPQGSFAFGHTHDLSATLQLEVKNWC